VELVVFQDDRRNQNVQDVHMRLTEDANSSSDSGDFGALRKTCTCTPPFSPTDRRGTGRADGVGLVLMSRVGRLKCGIAVAQTIQWMSLLWRCGNLVLSESSCRIKLRIESRRGHRYRPQLLRSFSLIPR